MQREAILENDGFLALETATTRLVFRKDGKTWRTCYYGAKAGGVCEIGEMASDWMDGETYPSFGGDLGGTMNRHGAIAARHADGDTSIQWKCSRVERAVDLKGAEHIVFSLADNAHKFRARQHFRAIYDCDVIETWVELKNGEDGPVELSRMDSFGFEKPGLAEEFHVLSLCGSWGQEANMAESSVATGQTVRLGTHLGVHGTFENNPAFMLSLGRRADEESGIVIGGALAWSGAWEIAVEHTCNHDLWIYAGAANVAGPYILDAGKSITLPVFAFTYSSHGKGDVSRAFHRWAREWRMPHGRTTRDILLNSWEGAHFHFNEKTLTDMMDGVREMGGEMFVIDDGWFGRGEFARNDDRRGLGDWCWNYEKLPNGPAYLVREAAKRGLKLGLWFEPEMANTRSMIATEHPDWIMHEKGRKIRCGRGGTQVLLDMSNPAVRDNVFHQIDAVLRAAKGIEYIKWDANCDFLNPGSAYLDERHQANIWFDYTAGVFELFAKLRAKYPDIVFQACASGGGHVDYGWLGQSDEIWGSDNTCSQQRVLIQWGEEQFYPASAIAAHVTLSPNHQTGRDAPLKYRFDVAMSGRMGFELRPETLTPEEVEFSKKAVEVYKRIRETVQLGDLYRLDSPYECDHASMLFASRDKSHAVLMVYGRERVANRDCANLRVRGLDPNRKYFIEEVNMAAKPNGEPRCHVKGVHGDTVSGAALMAVGIQYWLSPENDSFVVEFTAADQRRR